MEALVQPGMVSDLPSDTRNNEDIGSAHPEKDYFV
jgi:S-adenosylmethionine decarboxylase